MVFYLLNLIQFRQQKFFSNVLPSKLVKLIYSVLANTFQLWQASSISFCSVIRVFYWLLLLWGISVHQGKYQRRKNNLAGKALKGHWISSENTNTLRDATVFCFMGKRETAHIYRRKLKKGQCWGFHFKAFPSSHYWFYVNSNILTRQC